MRSLIKFMIGRRVTDSLLRYIEYSRIDKDPGYSEPGKLAEYKQEFINNRESNKALCRYLRELNRHHNFE